MGFISGPPSPCVGICRLEADQQGKDFCVGCQRSVDEIIDWPSMTDSEKQQVLDRIKNAQPQSQQ